MLLVCLLLCIGMISANPHFVENMEPQTIVMCSDEVTRCPSDHICCKLEGGTFGCCLQHTPEQRRHGVPEKKPTNLFLAANITVSSPCPDPSYTCPGDETCCSTGSGWGCCPYDGGSCCSDEAHCCPQGTVCIFDICI